MKIVMALLAFVSVTAFASSEENSSAEILEALIQDSNLTLVEEDGQKSESTLASVLAQALAVRSLASPGESTVITSVSGNCEVTDIGRGGLRYLDCSLYITDGDYLATENGYVGPELESATILTFKAIQSPNGKLKAQGKVKRSIAG